MDSGTRSIGKDDSGRTLEEAVWNERLDLLLFGLNAWMLGWKRNVGQIDHRGGVGKVWTGRLDVGRLDE